MKNIFKIFNINKDLYSQSGQDQFAYNLSGKNGYYLEIGAHDPIINSNTYKLEVECQWQGLSVELDKSYKQYWEKCDKRKNKILWENAFDIDYQELVIKNIIPKKINYLSCDIEPPENTFNILKKIINSGISFEFISFEHDKYQIGEKFEKLSSNFLNKNGYKIAVTDVYSRSKKNKIYETWFVKNEIKFDKVSYEYWKKTFYKKSIFESF